MGSVCWVGVCGRGARHGRCSRRWQCDVQKDGLRAWGGFIWNDSIGSHYIRLEDSNGSYPIGDCTRKDVDIPEGVKVTVKACLKDGANGTPRFCYTVTGTA